MVNVFHGNPYIKVMICLSVYVSVCQYQSIISPTHLVLLKVNLLIVPWGIFNYFKNPNPLREIALRKISFLYDYKTKIGWKVSTNSFPPRGLYGGGN